MRVDKLVTETLNTLPGDLPVLEVVARMHADIQARSGLDDRTYLLVRLAALVSLDASVPTYLTSVALFDELGLSFEDVQAVLIAVAPVVGGARVIAAADKIQQAIAEGRRM
jgi:4-carboxymuconolactone decarboxylase